MRAACLRDRAGRRAEVLEKQAAQMPRADSQTICEAFDAVLVETALLDQPQRARHRGRGAEPGWRPRSAFRPAAQARTISRLGCPRPASAAVQRRAPALPIVVRATEASRFACKRGDTIMRRSIPIAMLATMSLAFGAVPAFPGARADNTMKLSRYTVYTLENSLGGTFAQGTSIDEKDEIGGF